MANGNGTLPVQSFGSYRLHLPFEMESAVYDRLFSQTRLCCGQSKNWHKVSKSPSLQTATHGTSYLTFLATVLGFPAPLTQIQQFTFRRFVLLITAPPVAEDR